MGGELVTASRRPGQIVPVDRAFRARPGAAPGDRSEVRRLVLTASGGPFRGRTRVDLDGVTRPKRSPTRPGTWARVVTTNSATLVNKGLEVIEAHLLFDVPYDAHRGDGAPAVDRALDGRVRRRVDDRAGVPARHASADLARPRLAATGCRGRARRSTGRVASSVDLRAARRRRPSRRWRWPSGSDARAAPTPRCSTPRTSRPSTRSTRADCRSRESSRSSSGSSRDTRRRRRVLPRLLAAAEEWARGRSGSRHRRVRELISSSRGRPGAGRRGHLLAPRSRATSACPPDVEEVLVPGPHHRMASPSSASETAFLERLLGVVDAEQPAGGRLLHGALVELLADEGRDSPSAGCSP